MKLLEKVSSKHDRMPRFARHPFLSSFIANALLEYR